VLPKEIETRGPGQNAVYAACYYWLLAESHLTRRLFESMMRRIVDLPLPAR
jgi:hypothetical protein